jgi:hypothetical protein
MKCSYRAIRTYQADRSKSLVLFAAPAPEIAAWTGIPQKKRFGSGEETAGFQREENTKRVKSLSEFYENPSNIIQNPLLCALRDLEFTKVSFIPSNDINDDITEFGELQIEFPSYDEFTLHEVLKKVKQHLETRVPELKQTEPRQELLIALKIKAAEAGHVDATENSVESETSDDDYDQPDPASALFEESHIVDFWHEIACRERILSELGESFDEDEFLGFTREALLTYLKPVVLVDGQHRLGGALFAASAAVNGPEFREEIEERITQGEDPEIVRESIINRIARPLPISLILSDSPGEQVFQFVIVNQKATPVGKALLGTIISTSLSNDEMAAVAGRLKAAGIELIESQAITFLARHPSSPFCNLIERGLTGDSNDLLKWNVFSSLISVFRDLRGGRLYGQKNDYAEMWRHRCLNESKIVEDFESSGFDSAFEYWRQIDGPWRPIFIAFFTKIRECFGNIVDPDKPNFWGRPRDSNLFNKVSLNILAADFFQYLTETKSRIDSPESVGELVESWLEYVNLGYFDKSWDLAGVKKDSTGIRNQWALLWSEYRKSGGNLPDKRLYRKAKAD